MTTRWDERVRPDRAQMLATVAVAGLVVGFVLVATQSTLLAAVASAAALLILGLVALGGYRVAVLILMMAFAVAPVYRGLIPALSEGITPVDLLMAAGIFLMLPVLLQRRLQVPLAYIVGVGIVMAAGLVASVGADAPLQSFTLLVNWMLMMVALPVVFALWGPTRREITALLWSYVAGQMVSLGVALAEGPLVNDRFDGLTRHPNSFGEAGVTALAILLFLLHRHRGSVRLQALVLLCAGLSVASVVLSGSRAALVVAAVLILLIPVVERSAVLGFVFAIVGALALMAFTTSARFASEGSAISRLAGNSTTTGADRVRSKGREYGWERFLEDPVLGSGLQGVDFVHDLNIAVLAAVGIVGFFGYVVVMFTFARPLFGDGRLRRLSYVVWSYLGLAPTVPSLFDRTTWLPMALSIVAVIEYNRRRQDEATATEPEVSPGLA